MNLVERGFNNLKIGDRVQSRNTQNFGKIVALGMGAWSADKEDQILIVWSHGGKSFLDKEFDGEYVEWIGE